MGLLDIIKSAGDAKMDIMNKIMNPNGDGMYGKASQFLGGLEQRKNELFNPRSTTLGALGFGQADSIRGMGQIPRIREFQAADSAKMMQNSLASIGANIPAAGMVSQGSMDLSTPDLTSPFMPNPVDFYDPLAEEQAALEAQAAQSAPGVLTDPYQYAPSAGMLDMGSN
jgi:hypothetical protein